MDPYSSFLYMFGEVWESKVHFVQSDLQSGNPLKIIAIGPGAHLILDLHVDRIICIPVQGLFQ